MNDATTRRTATLEDIRAAAHVALERVGLDAVLLHGSRARGDAHETSDWDIMALGKYAEKHRKKIQTAFAHLEQVDIATSTAEIIQRERNSALRLGNGVAREAQVLAGSWERPGGLTRWPKPGAEDLRQTLEELTADSVHALFWYQMETEEQWERYSKELQNLTCRTARTTATVIRLTLDDARGEHRRLKTEAAAHKKEANGGFRECDVIVPGAATPARMKRSFELQWRWMKAYSEQEPEGGERWTNLKHNWEHMRRNAAIMTPDKNMKWADPCNVHEAFQLWVKQMTELGERLATREDGAGR